MHIKVLVLDAFGGRGGIAKFNRDFLTALCSHPLCTSVTAFTRLMPDPPGPLPSKLTFVTDGLNSKARYARCVAKSALCKPKPDLLFCGHIHLLPLARLLQVASGAPMALVTHGVEAWSPTGRRLTDRLACQVPAFLAVSNFTKQRFLAWTGLRPEQGYVLPNSVALEDFAPGSADDHLVRRYRLHGRKVILTMGRLCEEERLKGIDEVMEALPALARRIPDLAYIVAGEGDDRRRLEQKAAALGVAERTIFTGYVPEEEKADHYRLADAFVMPGRGEGFGIVYLEAMACGIPVVASKLDASSEAVGGESVLVDPKNQEELQAGILQALRRPKGTIPARLEHFSFANFSRRCHRIVDEILASAKK